ncbi:hypothetical protein DFH11DRAFT_1545724 [Phellopilus nigrolimitatus]|nr:hypothetical protein DFH11DRAFT_1545724 [Phellopilus nigrolimitatus]
MLCTPVRSERRCRQQWAEVAVGFLIASNVTAVASAPLTRRQQNSGGNSGQNFGGVAPQVWIPAVVVVLVLLGAFCFVWTRTNILSRLRGAATRVTHSGPAAGTREVTASQLAGHSNSSNNTGGLSATIRAVRNPRRTRRTASQMSTTSLPVYMKEPGAQELVIFRGPEEMDASHAIAEAREAEEREDEREERDSPDVGMRDSGMYNPLPLRSPGLVPTMTAPHDPSALDLPSNDDNPDASTAELLRRRSEANLSQNSGDAGDNRSIFIRPTSDVPSEAPPEYVSEQGHSIVSAPPGLVTVLSTSPATETVPGAASPPSTPESARNTRRRSRLASRVSNILHLRSGSSESSASGTRPTTQGVDMPEPPALAHISNAPTPQPSSNLAAAASVMTLSDPHTAEVPPRNSSSPSVPRHLRHRASHSGGSSSTLNLPLFRSLSRQRSNTTLGGHGGAGGGGSRTNLTSPSALSLSLAAGAISAPLAHTLVRTEIRYPAGGPTPEQIRLISSRDGLGRFSVPYGRDAVEHAQNSRLELALDPPPVFESPTEGSWPNAVHNEGVDADDVDALPSSFRSEGSNGGTDSHSGHRRDRSRSPTPDRRQDNSAAGYGASRIFVPLFM